MFVDAKHPKRVEVRLAPCCVCGGKASTFFGGPPLCSKDYRVVRKWYKEYRKAEKELKGE